MTPAHNDALAELYHSWRLEADWMTCKACGRHLIASRDGQPMVHADRCKNAEQHHPWQLLRGILTSTSPKASGST